MNVLRRSVGNAMAQTALHEFAHELPTGGRNAARLIFNLERDIEDIQYDGQVDRSIESGQMEVDEIDEEECTKCQAIKSN